MVTKKNKDLVNSDYSSIERRHTPRITATFRIEFKDNASGNTLNINETGACIESTKFLDLKKTIIKIILPSNPVIVEILPIWFREDKKSGKFLQGVKFINTTEKILSVIRRSLVYRQLKFVVKDINDKKERAEIIKFAKSFKQYLFDLFGLTSELKKESISQEEATHRLTNLTDDIMKKGDLLELSINNRRLIKRIKQDFRTLVGCWAYKSYIVKRSLDKPRGYPGDYKVVETIYDNCVLSEGIGWCFDRYFQNNTYAIAVRNRKNKMKDILKSFISARKNGIIKITNIACGSNREIKELFLPKRSNFFEKEIQFNLLDQDKEALDYSRKNLPHHPNVRYNFVNENIYSLIRNSEAQKKQLNCQDLVYSIGLADYLPDRVLGKLLNFLFDLVKSNGRLVIAHKDITKYKPLPPNWFCDWTFYARDKTALEAIIRKYIDVRKAAINMDYEKSGHILFITVIKES